MTDMKIAFEKAQDAVMEYVCSFKRCLDSYGAKQHTKKDRICPTCRREFCCLLSDQAFVTECKFYSEEKK